MKSPKQGLITQKRGFPWAITPIARTPLDIVKTLEGANLYAARQELVRISTVREIGVAADYCEEHSIVVIFCHNKSGRGVLGSGKALLSQLFDTLANRSWLRREFAEPSLLW